MTRKLILIIGEPGTGKTTVAKGIMGALTELSDASYISRQVALIPFTEYGWEDGKIWRVLGVFDDYPGASYAQGTDRMSMGVQPKFTQWLADQKGNLIVEGDRLANVKTVEAALENDYEVWVFHLRTLDGVLKDRYRARGSDQSPVFLKGRKTKMRNLGNYLGQLGPLVNYRPFTNNRGSDLLDIYGLIHEII